MSDERRRDLERKAATTGSESDRLAVATERMRAGAKLRDLPPEEQVAVLRSRREAGDLSEQGLALAAWAGLPSAQRLVEGEHPDLATCDTLDGLCERVDELDRFGPMAVRQVVAVLARFAVGACPQELRPDDTEDALDLPREVGAAVASWAAGWSTEPSGTLASAIGTLQERLAARSGLEEDDLHEALDRWPRAAAFAYWWLRTVDEPDDASQAAELVRTLCEGEMGCHVCQPGDGHEHHGPFVPPAAVARELGAALIRVGLTPVAPPKASGPREYSPKVRLAVGDVVDHPKFGRGRVTRVASRQADVLFDDGTTRKLAHA